MEKCLESSHSSTQSKEGYMRLLLAPEPRGDGGPSLAVRRLLPYLETSGFTLVSKFSSSWDTALVNVLGGYRGIGVIASGKPFLYRAAGYYVREIFDRTGRKWLRQYELANFLTRLFLSRAKMVVYQSLYAKNRLSKFTKEVNRRSVIIHNGVRLDSFKPKYHNTNSVPVIGTVGKFRHERASVILRTSRMLHLPHKLLIGGPMSNEDQQMFQEYAHRRGIDVHFTGYVSAQNLPEIYNQIDVFIHPVAADVCPNVVVEALASGVPVVCHAFGGAVELVGAGGVSVDGNPFEADDVFISKMSEAIIEVLSELDLYRKLARSQAELALDINVTAAKYIEAFSKVVT